MDGEYTRADDGWDSGWNDDDNCEDEMYNCDPHGSDSDVDLQELEEALYSQIHYGSGIGEAMTCQVGDRLCDVQVEDKSEVQAEEESTVLVNDNSINESNRNNYLPASGVHKVDSLDVSPKKSESANFAISHKCPMKNSKPKKKVSRLGLKQFLYKNENKELDNSRRSSDAKIHRNEGTDSSSSCDSREAKSKTNISQSKERVIIESSNSDVILLDSNTDDKISASKDLDSSGSCIVVDNDAVTQSLRTSAESAEIPDNVVVIDSDFSSDQESDSSFLVFTSSDDDTSPVPKGKKKTSKLADLNINIQDYKHLLESGDSDNDVGETGTRIELQKSKPFVRATSRYYGLANIRCFICNENGHTSKSCPKPKSLPVCILCGVRGHIQGRCPDSLCYRCNHVGHRSTDCELRWGTYNAVCRRCDMTGHMASECSDLWRQYHITNGLGPLVKGSGKINKNPFCYNCAKKGHFGFECKKKPMQDRMLPCCPLISRYALPSVANYPMSHKRKFPDCSAFQQEVTQEVPIKRPRIQQPIALNDISEFASKAKKKLTKQEKKALKIAKKEMASKQKLPKKKKKAAAAKEITKSKDESPLMSKNQKKRSKRKKKIAKIKEDIKKGRRRNNRQKKTGSDNCVNRTFYNENHYNQRTEWRGQPLGPSQSRKQHVMVSERGFQTTCTSYPRSNRY